MLHEEAKRFEKEILNPDFPYNDIELNQEAHGYAVGWLYCIIRNPTKNPRANRLTQHIRKYELLKKFITREYKETNKNIACDDKEKNRLICYVMEGFAKYNGNVPEDVQHSIIFGYNAH